MQHVDFFNLASLTVGCESCWFDCLKKAHLIKPECYTSQWDNDILYSDTFYIDERKCPNDFGDLQTFLLCHQRVNIFTYPVNISTTTS